MTDRLPKLCFLTLLLVSAARFSLLYPQLPKLMEAHFRADGTPNGWQTKPEFFLFSGMIAALLALLVFGLPPLIRALPESRIHLPNTRLSASQREGTLSFVSAWFAWLGCALYLVLFTALDYAVESTRHPDRRPSPGRLTAALLGLLCFAVVWTAVFIMRFAKRRAGGNGQAGSESTEKV